MNNESADIMKAVVPSTARQDVSLKQVSCSVNITIRRGKRLSSSYMSHVCFLNRGHGRSHWLLVVAWGLEHSDRAACYGGGACSQLCYALGHPTLHLV